MKVAPIIGAIETIVVSDKLARRATSHRLRAMQQVVERSFVSKESSLVGKESDIPQVGAMQQVVKRSFASKESSLVSKTRQLETRLRFERPSP